MKKLFTAILILSALSLSAANIYFDCSVSDTTGDGTSGDPYKYVGQHWPEIANGDSLFLKGDADSVYQNDDYIRSYWWNNSAIQNIVVIGYGEYPPKIQSESSSYMLYDMYDMTFYNIIFNDVDDILTEDIRGTVKFYDCMIYLGNRMFDDDVNGTGYFYAYNTIFTLKDETYFFCHPTTGSGNLEDKVFYFYHCLFDGNGKTSTVLFYFEPDGPVTNVFQDCIFNDVDDDYAYSNNVDDHPNWQYTNCMLDTTVFKFAGGTTTLTNCYKYIDNGTYDPRFIFDTTNLYYNIRKNSPIWGKGSDYLQIGPVYRTTTGYYTGR